MKKLALLFLTLPAYGQVDLVSQQRLPKPVDSYQEGQRHRAELELLRQQAALLEQERLAREAERARCAETKALVTQILAKLYAQPTPDIDAIRNVTALLNGC